MDFHNFQLLLMDFNLICQILIDFDRGRGKGKNPPQYLGIGGL
jgi:hypothetical protein